MKPWILLFPLLIACSKPEESSQPLPSIEIQGFQYFGKVIVGSALGSTIVLRNHTSNAISYSLSGDSDFSIVPKESACQNEVPANRECSYKLLLLPSSKGEKAASLSFNEGKLDFSASAILPGKLTVAPSSVDIGTMIAGDIYRFTLTLTNHGDVRAMFPAFLGSNSIGVEAQTCGLYIEPSEICTAVVVYQNFVRTPNLAQTIQLSIGDSSAPLLVSGVIRAGEISGTIGFSSSPTQLFADGSTYSFETAILTDKYGNQIEDDLEATVSFYNLTKLDGSSEPMKVMSSGGRLKAQFRTTLTPGNSVLSVNTFTSSGTLNFTVQSP